MDYVERTIVYKTNSFIAINENFLRDLVAAISERSSSLLEIVNYNVDGEQYVCAGTVSQHHSL